MNKNGKLVMDETIKGTLAVIMLIFIFVAILFGLFGRTKASAEEKLLSADKLKDVLKKLTTTPGKAEFDRQEVQTTEIATVIKETIDKMSDTDCIEQLDFSKIENKDFIVKFEKIGEGSKLSLYKFYNQEGYFFEHNLLVPVYYSVIKSSETASIEEVTEFKINNLQEIEFNEEKEKLNTFLYKNKEEKIIFSSDIFYSIYKIKQICSDGNYLGDIDPDEFINNDYNKIIISESMHTIDNKDKELDIKRKYLGSFKKYESLWYKEREDKFPIYDDENMVKLVNLLRKAKFRIELIYYRKVYI